MLAVVVGVGVGGQLVSGGGGGKLCLNVNLFNFFLSPVISIFFSSSV